MIPDSANTEYGDTFSKFPQRKALNSSAHEDLQPRLSLSPAGVLEGHYCRLGRYSHANHSTAARQELRLTVTYKHSLFAPQEYPAMPNPFATKLVQLDPSGLILSSGWFSPSAWSVSVLKDLQYCHDGCLVVAGGSRHFMHTR